MKQLIIRDEEYCFSKGYIIIEDISEWYRIVWGLEKLMALKGFVRYDLSDVAQKDLDNEIEYLDNLIRILRTPI